MLLVLASCSTDWKGRPSHVIEVVEGSVEKLREIQRVRIRTDQIADLEGDYENERDSNPGRPMGNLSPSVLSKLSDKELGEVWELDQVRWEMDLDSDTQRIFSYNDGEGDHASISYTLLNADPA